MGTAWLRRALAQQEKDAIRWLLTKLKVTTSNWVVAQRTKWWRSLEDLLALWMAFGLLASTAVLTWVWKEDENHEASVALWTRRTLQKCLNEIQTPEIIIRAVCRSTLLWLGLFFVVAWWCLWSHWSVSVVGALSLFGHVWISQVQLYMQGQFGLRRKTKASVLAVLELVLGLGCLVCWWRFPPHMQAATQGMTQFDPTKLEYAATMKLKKFVPEVEYGLVIDVYDGDTLTSTRHITDQYLPKSV